MRSKKAFFNSICCIIEELAAIACVFVLPKVILATFGSKYNGVVTSITQFLAFSMLLRTGIGGATRAALYKPLANHDEKKISEIVKATSIYMRKIAFILLWLILICAIIYPFFVRNDFDWFFTFTLFIIIGISTFAESFFGITYLIVIQADQKIWVSALLKSLSYILNLVISLILIKVGCGIHIVKLASSLVFVIHPLGIQFYVKKHYNIDNNVRPDNTAISQRWDVFWHQVSSFVMLNTDVIILTIFLNVLEVSVYSVYNLVINGLQRFITTFSNSLEGAFGSMIAKNEENKLRKNFDIVEQVIYSISTVAFTCAIILILSFVEIYTLGITDTNYLRPSFAYVLLVAQFINCIRIPYKILIQAAGEYNNTKNGAIIEPIINITLSILFVFKFGLVGVAIGTLIATLFRTIELSIFVSSNIIKRNQLNSLYRLLLSFVEGIIVIFIFNYYKLPYVINYCGWIVNGIIVFIVACLVVLLFEFIFYRDNIHSLIGIIKRLLIKNKNEGVK